MVSFGGLRPRRLRGGADEVLGEARDVFAPLAQRRILDREDAEPIKQILAEAAGDDLVFQVAIGRGDDAHIDLARARVADALDFLLLQNAQQLGLHRERHFADLIEEKRAAIGQLEAAGLVAERAGERAFHVAEEFALEERLGHRGAIDLDHRPVAARAALVDGAGHEFLAGAAFAGDEHGGIGGGDEFDLPEHFSQRRAFADDVASAARRGHFLAQVAVFLLEPLFEIRDLLEGVGVGDAHGGVIGENAQPLEIRFGEHQAIEKRQHAEHFAAKNERLRRKRATPSLRNQSPSAIQSSSPRSTGSSSGWPVAATRPIFGTPSGKRRKAAICARPCGWATRLPALATWCRQRV